VRVLHAELPCGFLRTDAEGQVLAANPALASALGYAGVEALPERLDALLPAPGRLYYQINVRPTLSRGDGMEEVYLDLQTAAGELMPMLINITVADAAGAHDWALMRVTQRGRWEAAMLEARREAERKTEELARASAELARAMAELKENNWLLRKVAEVLPTCMYCGQVKAGERDWQTAIEYLNRNSRFLSHGCCPACVERMRREMGLPDDEE
jgi:hypothetical protein